MMIIARDSIIGLFYLHHFCSNAVLLQAGPATTSIASLCLQFTS